MGVRLVFVIIISFSLITSFILYPLSAFAENGFSSWPAEYVFNGVVTGKKIKVPNPISVTNKDTHKRLFTLEFCKPKEIGIAVPEGFQEPGSLEWFSLTNNKLMLAPQERERVDMYVNIPEDEKFKGKKFIVYVKITRIALPSIKFMTVPEQFRLACYLKFVIET